MVSSSTPGIRWGRILIAAIASEVGVVAALSVAIGIYMLQAPALTEAQRSTLGQDVGYYVAPAAGAVMTFLAVLWAARPLTSRFVLHGVLVGVASVLLTLGFIVGARPEDRLMYVVAFALRLVAGFVGGVTAQSKFHKRTARTIPVNQSV